MTRRVLATVLAIAVSASACTTEGLAFREDNRVEIVSPADREEVHLPVEVAWSVDDLAPGTRYAVFVDKSPLPPGKHLDTWVARNDDGCKRSPGCPDEKYLADRHIHVTDEPEVEILTVPSRGTDREYRDFHEVTVVLLDEAGRRAGESAWSVQFRVAR